MPSYLTTAAAARELGVSPRRVRHLIERGRLRARKHGRDYLISPADLDPVRNRRNGRPSVQ